MGCCPREGREEQQENKNFGQPFGFFCFLFLFFFFLPSSEVVFSTFCHQDIAIIANFGVQTKRPLKCSSESTATPYP